MAGEVVRISIGGLAGSAIAGASQGLTVTAFQAGDVVATDYTGTVRFSSSDLQSSLPAEYQFTAGDSGSRSFAATLKTAGNQSLSVVDAANASLTATSSIVVSPATTSGFVVTGFTSGATAGVSQQFGVSAVDAYGNVTPAYTGTVRFSNSDPLGTVPANYQFTASDEGNRTFSSTMKTAGDQSLSVTDTVNAGLVGSRTGIVVVAAAAKNVTVSGFPTPTAAGTPNSVTVTAKDTYGNVATGYAGTVRFTSTDSAATLPGNYTFTTADAGVHTFQATLNSVGLRTITATDVAISTITGKQQNIEVTVAAASRFTIAAPVNVDPGVPFQITVTAKDAYANVITGYTGTVHFTSDDALAALPADYAFTAADAGVRTFNVTLEQSGRRRITATDTADTAITGFQSNITVAAAAAVESFSVTGFPNPVAAGTPGSVTVTARDAYGNVVTSYAGTVRFTSTDLAATLPADYTFTTADAGVHTFQATLNSVGLRTITATDVATATVTGKQQDIQVNAAAASRFTVAAPVNVGAGQSFQITVTAKDTFDGVATGYTGTVHFTSDDALAALPADYTFTAADAGVHTFNVTLKQSGPRLITATDVAAPAITGDQSSRTVVAAAAAKNFTVSGFPNPVAAGTPGSVTVTAHDAYGNVVTSYAGTVRFTSTDLAATLPADYTFTTADAGVHTFQAALNSGGVRTITATDVVTATIAGKQQDIQVNAAAASRFTIAAPANVGAGIPFQITVTAKDAAGNVATDYTGTIHFTSDDFTADLPADYTFTAADAGVHTFNVTLEQNGRRKITATDVTDPTITGFQSNMYVTGGTAGYDPGTNTIFAYGSGIFTLSRLAELLPTAPLSLIDTANHVWYLGANIVLKDGAILNLHGTSKGGDVNELRIKSDNTADPHAFASVRAIYGEIDIDTTKITSWDSAVGGPDTETDLYGRAFLAVRSYFAPDGVTPLESRMDIYNSDVGYLGSLNSEAYGLTWKAAGYGAELHSRLRVYGDVYDSRIHHNYFGIYTWGAFGMNIVGNETDYNIGYGIDPHDDSNNLLIEGNYSHHNGWHGIIASQHCNNIIIRNNISINNGKHGIMLHRSSNNGLIEGNTVTGNGEIGIALFESFNTIVRNNTVSGNLSGVRFSMGAGNNLVENNQIFNNIQYGISSILGSDPKEVNDGRPAGNIIRGNQIYGNVEYGIRIKEGDRNLIQGNNIYSNAIRFEVAIDNILTGNTLAADVLIENAGDETTTTRTILRDQANAKVVLKPFSTVVAESTTGGVFRVSNLGRKHTLGITGSSLTLNASDFNGETLVLGMTNLATVVTAPATITPTLNGTTGQVSGWTTQASVSSQPIKYLLTGLVPNTSYTITKGGNFLVSFTTNASGAASFTNATGTLSPVVYTLTRTKTNGK